MVVVAYSRLGGYREHRFGCGIWNLELIRGLTVTLEDLWRQKSDRELKVAARQLDDYREDAQQVILAEMHRRGMVETALKASVALQFPPQQSETRYAGFWIRFGAAWIDGLILRVLAARFAYAIASFSKANLEEVQLLTNGSVIFIGWLYFAFLESSSEQTTLGKQAFGIFVTDLDGGHISFFRASGRFLVKLLAAPFLVGYFMAAFTKKHQALYDLIASTLVVKKHIR